MKLKGLNTASLLAAVGFIQLVVASPSLSQTDLNTRLRQALCAQNWGQAMQIIDQMKRAAGPQYAAQLTLYRGQIATLARENVNLSKLLDKCSEASTPSTTTPTENSIPPTPSSDIPSAPNTGIPTLPNSDIPPTPNIGIPTLPSSDNLPPPPPIP